MILDLANVSYKKTGEYILKNINWQVKSGEHWVILGTNGAGKTTLLNMINGYIFPSKGEITVLGQTFGKTLIAEMRKSIGWVSNLLSEQIHPDDICLNIILSGKFSSIGLWDETNEEDHNEALELLKLFHSESFAFRTFASLSQGEKQKILICRALMTKPKLLILDEPCNGLDLFAKKELFSFIDLLIKKAEINLIYVTHNIDEINNNFTHGMLLKEGQVHSSGLINQILTKDNLEHFYGAKIELVSLKNGSILVNLID